LPDSTGCSAATFSVVALWLVAAPPHGLRVLVDWTDRGRADATRAGRRVERATPRAALRAGLVAVLCCLAPQAWGLPSTASPEPSRDDKVRTKHH